MVSATYTLPDRVARRAPEHSDAQALLSLEGVGGAAREALERCIAERFASQYDAQLDHYLPWLLRLGHADRPSAVVGLQPAGAERLFAEQYLSQPVEQAISEALRAPVDRAQVVEIGNLVSLEAGTSYVLFAVLADMLRRAGFRWVACTATRQVESLLNGMGFEPHVICAARGECLGADQARWGSYYRSRPRVITGDLEDAAAMVAAHPVMADAVATLEPQVTAIATQLARQARS